MSEHALEDLNKFLLLAKTTKGAATAALIREVLEHPNVYVFGELLALPNVQEVCMRTSRSAPAHAQAPRPLGAGARTSPTPARPPPPPALPQPTCLPASLSSPR